MVREATVERKTGETSISVTLGLDVAPGAKQEINVSTGVGFMDHVSGRRRAAGELEAGRKSSRRRGGSRAGGRTRLYAVPGQWVSHHTWSAAI